MTTMMHPAISARKIKEIFENSSMNYKTRFKKASQEAQNFIYSLPIYFIRNDTMFFLIAIDEIFDDINDNDDDSDNDNVGFVDDDEIFDDDDDFVDDILEYILSCYESHIKNVCKNAKEIKDARFDQISDETWV
uniref:Uncharacterized protein n=1 Tax=Panagrolaimus sp. ES5 TaxID=591445 RepID=A0AC34FU33_9BILA